MKKIAFITALLGVSVSAQAHDIFGSASHDTDTVSVVSDNTGRLHGYTIPFAKSVEAASTGQYADAGQFGRITAYDNAINKKHSVSKGVYANVGQFGRLSGYGRSAIVDSATAIASK